MKTKTMSVKDRRAGIVQSCPSFSATGSIAGMKRKFYGKEAKLIRCGSWIYNASANPAAEAVYDSIPT